MKSIIFFFCLTFLICSCNKVENAYPTGSNTKLDLDTTLYPGNFSDYIAPVFSLNTNINRNILLEDYTGHKCPNCPPAGALALQIEADVASGGRVFIASIHASPGGLGPFQETNTIFTTDFTCPEGLEYGTFFNIGYGFSGNPRGTINRVNLANDMFKNATNWQNAVTSQLTANTLTVNLQASADYFPTTRGVYLHVQIDPILTLPTNSKLVIYCIEDSLIARQMLQSSVEDPAYIHHDILRSTITGQAFGQSLSTFTPDASGNYLLKYSYVLPTAIDPTNFHFLVYLMDGDTYEVLQVIKTVLP
jgi:hypothetical protein